MVDRWHGTTTNGSQRRKGTVDLKKNLVVALFVILNVLAIASVAAAEVSTLGPGPLRGN